MAVFCNVSRRVAVLAPRAAFAVFCFLMLWHASATRTSSGLLFEYDLRNGQDVNSAPNAFATDSVASNFLGSLSMSPRTTWLGTRIGLQTLHAVSATGAVSASASSNGLRQAMLSNGELTVETWFQWSSTNPAYTGFMWGVVDFVANGVNPNACDNANFYMQQEGTLVNVWIAGMTDYGSSCDAASVALSPALGLNHVVVTKSGVNQQVKIYVNSVLKAFSPAYAVNMSNWSPTATLQVGTPSASYKWGGSTFLIAAYNRVLSSAEVSANCAAGLPNSIPITRNSTVQGVEDSLLPIMLNASDYETASNLLTVKIVSLPHKGALYRNSSKSAASKITSVPFTVPLVNGKRWVYYLGPSLGNGNNFASFRSGLLILCRVSEQTLK